MASGKQLSFQFGEVSPSLRFRSDSVPYSAGLSRLKNMFVKKTGGISNRPGFEYMSVPDQTVIPSMGENPKIKSFTFWDSVDERWKTLTYRNKTSTTYALYLDLIEISVPGGALTSASPSPHEIKFTVLKEHVLISPDVTTSYSQLLLYVMGTNTVTSIGTPFFPTASLSGLGTGYAPFLPVSFLFTAVLKSGQEVYIQEVKTTGYNPTTWNPSTGSGATNVYHPHASYSTNMILTWNALAQPYLNYVQYFNLYRAAGAQGFPNSYFKLAARQPYVSGLSITFHDFGVEDASFTPSLQNDMYDDGLSLTGITCAAYYQQRLIYVLKPGIGDIAKAGDIFVSKIGAPTQVRMPTIYRDTEAFQFSVPITDGTPVVALLAMERLIAFTERGVYVIRGGEQGILTPTQVNPLLISDEGCSKIVEPKMAGRRGYFLNSTHTKLMGIAFGDDANLTVSDVSITSDHLLKEEDIVQMEVIGGIEDVVYLLRRDGKLIQITCHEDGAHGFSIYETTGYIESIYRGKALRPYVDRANTNTYLYYDVLRAYIISPSGQRTSQLLQTRDDSNKEAEFFADSHRRFGYRLSNNGINGYAQIQYGGVALPTRICNLKSSIGWSAGTVIKLRSNTAFLFGEVASHTRVRFFYDEDGVESYIDFTWNGSAATSISDGSFIYEYSGTFDKDVPSVLQDVKAQSLTTYEKQLRYTRWLLAFNRLTTFDSLGSSASHGAYALEGAVIGAGRFTIGSTEATAVAIIAEGKVISSPLNSNFDTLYIENDGFLSLTLNLPDFYTYGVIGLPYESEMETLDLEASDARTFTDARKLLNAVGVAFENTRGGFFGIEDADLDNMAPMAPVLYSPYNNQEDTDNFNGHVSIPIPTSWSERGRVKIKQVDPLPMTVLAVYPKGVAGD